ncbi:MAG TPA: putative sulfate exporter family transporter [Steroidobacteraceae bacterium]|nr:putative sulfate exporter family transporter [Steroidobacteraceae bacterium]
MPRVNDLFPGLVVAGMVALAASWLAEHYATPVMLFALLLGIAVNFLSQHEQCRPGLDFASRSLLRIGVALLGARITLTQVGSLGGAALLLTAAAVVLTILCGLMLARATRQSAAFGLLSGGSVGICGASAALAIASVLPRSDALERDTVMTVVAVTALSTVAMVLYPVVAAGFGLDERTAGIFLGATIHDVAQVVGAGYSVSTPAGDAATIVKLFRVAMLLPVVLVISFALQRRRTEASGAMQGDAPSLLPAFLVVFASLVAVNSLGWLPDALTSSLQEASRWSLVVAIAALGTKTSLAELAGVGWRPVAIIVTETAFVGLFVLAGLSLLGA